MSNITRFGHTSLGWFSTMASRDRHSPVASLASLEFLQNQRRGSITDPSLHSFSSSKYMSRPSSPYVFGDATAEPSSHLRKLLHSPSSEHRSISQEQLRNHSGTPISTPPTPHSSPPPRFHPCRQRQTPIHKPPQHSRSSCFRL